MYKGDEHMEKISRFSLSKLLLYGDRRCFYTQPFLCSIIKEQILILFFLNNTIA
jgi:hypothetical protein